MGDIAIRVSNLGKRYRIGEKAAPYRTLRDAIANVAAAPIKQLRSGGRPAVPGYFWALKDISFDVNKGDIVGIVGRNGAGKSTLLKLLSKVTEPTEGRAEIHGRIGSLLEVGTGFHPELTGLENIYLSGSILGMRRFEIDSKLDEIIKFAEIEKFIDTPVKHYSSGMYVRLAFAVSAHLDTDILFLDEVLAVGDIGFQKKCINKLAESTRNDRTVLIVSHNMQVIANLCDRGIWIDKGKVRKTGDIKEIISDYGLSFRELITRENNRIVRARKGPGREPMIKWAEIKTDDDNYSTVYENGEYINLFVELDRNLPPASYFEWVLYSDRGFPATSGNTSLEGKHINIPPSSGILHIRIGPLLLAQGNYSLSLLLGTNPGYVMDEWNDIENIVISKCLVPDGGVPYDSRRGVVYTKSTYTDPAEERSGYMDRETS